MFVADIFPLAFAIVNAETDENWRWFLLKLADILRAQYRRVTFVTDRNSGLIKGIRDIFPESPHGFCIHHLDNNVRDLFPAYLGATVKENMVFRFNQCAYACTTQMFDVAVEEFKKQGRHLAENFLKNLPKENYAVSYFPGQRWGEMSNATAESFNKMIMEMREMPIMEMLEAMRVKVMTSMSEKRNLCAKWTSILCPNIENKMKSLMDEGRHWVVREGNESVYEVQADRNIFAVRLEERYCSCIQWQHTGFPCPHVLQVLLSKGCCIYDYVDDYWKTTAYRKTYELSIEPLPDLDKPDLSAATIFVRPPTSKKPPGRPKKKRELSKGERIRKPQRCSRCKQFGKHNKATCKAAIEG